MTQLMERELNAGGINGCADSGMPPGDGGGEGPGGDLSWWQVTMAHDPTGQMPGDGNGDAPGGSLSDHQGDDLAWWQATMDINGTPNGEPGGSLPGSGGGGLPGWLVTLAA